MGDFALGLSERFPGARWAPIPLRLIVGYGFMGHGYAKLSKGPEAFAVILGAFVAIVSAPMAVVLLVALFKVHLPYGFSSIKLIAVTAAGAQFGPPGYEVNLLYLACLAALVMGGAGPFTIDSFIGKRSGTVAPAHSPQFADRSATC